MPELPELAVLAQDLSRVSKNNPLTKVLFVGNIKFLDLIIPRDVRNVIRGMEGRRVSVSSSGKQLLIRSGPCRVSIRLGMTGRFQSQDVTPAHKAHHFATLRFGKRACHFVDFRRFARMSIEQSAYPPALGGFHEAKGFYLLSKERVAATFDEHLSWSRPIPRISWLLKHGKLTGVGNYIANEALARLALSPIRACRDRREALQILNMCQRIAKRSFQAGGTSFGSGYSRLDGRRGLFSQTFKIYQNHLAKRIMFAKRPVYSNCF